MKVALTFRSAFSPYAFDHAMDAAVFNDEDPGATGEAEPKQLAAFRAQGDDALHRQISADADLLGFDDLPRSVCVDRLLLECAKRL